MVMAGDQSAGRSDNIKTDNSCFERAEQFKYLGTATLTDQTAVQQEIKSRLQSGNACCHLVQNVLCYGLLYKNLKLRYSEL
jgi:hypothetical protein